MNLGTLQEAELFDMLKTSLIFDLEPRETMSKCDAYSPYYMMAIELKCRRKVYDDMLIEKSKYDFLRAHYHNRYIVSDPSGIYSFDLSLIEPAGWYPHYMPATTDFFNHDKIVKIVGYLPKKYAINITNKLTRNESSISSL